MAKHLNYCLISKSVYAIVLYSLLLWFPAEICAQPLKVVDSLSVFKPSDASLDDKGNIYITNNRGKITRITPELTRDLEYSPSTPAEISILDASHGLRIFIFYKTLQQFRYLDRFLSLSEKHNFNHPEIQFVSAATPSFDNNLWVLDQSTLRLMKFNISIQEIELSNSLEYSFPHTFDEIVLFREYHNNLFIGGDDEIFIFDNLGNFVNRLSLAGTWYGFHNNDIYYIKGNNVVFTNIYTGEQDSLRLPVVDANSVFFYDGWIFAIKGKVIYKIIR